MKLPPNFFKNIDRKAEQKAAKRKQRRKELWEKSITPDTRVVAWIDILGFREELLKAEADGEEGFQKAYRKLLKVRDAFEDPSASDDPEQLLEGHASYGRSVFALSDGLIITASLNNAKAKGIVSDYDLTTSLLGDLILAQADCALDGIFVRGGISIGPFYFENNTLLSPALVRAYELESKKAVYPIIIISAKDVEELRSKKGYKNYATDYEPSQYELRSFISPKQEAGDRFFHLDYLNLVTNLNTYGLNREQHGEINSGKYSRAESDHLFAVYMNRHAMNAMVKHKNALIKAYESAEVENVRAKYRWLMEYHNSAVRDGLSFYPERAMIDIDLVTGKLDVREAAAKLPDLPTDAAPEHSDAEALEETEQDTLE